MTMMGRKTMTSSRQVPSTFRIVKVVLLDKDNCPVCLRNACKSPL